MKFLSALLFAAILALSFNEKAHAIPDAAKSIRVEALSGATVGDIGAGAGAIKSSAWRTMISSATRALKGLYIFNSSNAFLKVAIGPSGSEQLQLIVPPGIQTGGVSAGQGFFYPLPISQGTKVAVEAADSDASQGYVVVGEFFY